jgi:hypothetical protein
MAAVKGLFLQPHQLQTTRNLFCQSSSFILPLQISLKKLFAFSFIKKLKDQISKPTSPNEL